MTGVGYSVSEEGISELRNLKKRLLQSMSLLGESGKQLKNEIETNREGGGPHIEQIQELTAKLDQEITGIAEPLFSVCDGIDTLIDAYEDIIGNAIAGGALLSQHNGQGMNTSQSAANPVSQSEHKPPLTTFTDKVNAVINDVKNNSGKQYTFDEARKITYSIESFTGTKSSAIRKAYTDASPNAKDLEMMNAIDDYIHNAPKWSGRVYRGIAVSNSVAEDILSKGTVDMLGPSSWSSEYSVADRFAKPTARDEDVGIVFVMDENISGTSVVHISPFSTTENEVLAPSGVIYQINDMYKDKKTDRIIVNVREIH